MPTAITATADDVASMLTSGKTLQETVTKTGWPHQQVKAVAARKNWLWTPDGRAYDPRKADRQTSKPGPKPKPTPASMPAPPPAAKPGPQPGPRPEPAAPKPPPTPAPAPSTRVSVADVTELITRASDMDDKAVQRELTRVTEALTRLRTAITVVDECAEQERQRQAVLDEVARLEAELAAAKARAKELGGKRTTAAKAPVKTSEASPKDIRAWAARAGVECNAHGRVRQDVVDQYEAANGGTA